MTIGRIDVAFEVAVAFDFCSSHVSTPFVQYRKWKKKSRCLSRRRVSDLPIFCTAQTGTPQGRRRLGRLFGIPFWRSKKGCSRRSTTGQQSSIDVCWCRKSNYSKHQQSEINSHNNLPKTPLDSSQKHAGMTSRKLFVYQSILSSIKLENEIHKPNHSHRPQNHWPAIVNRRMLVLKLTMSKSLDDMLRTPLDSSPKHAGAPARWNDVKKIIRVSKYHKFE
ncbi:hypothetical protein [Undibacterium sp. Ji49W]|uniref:hypothetical protein n=1 Tax=Undibacterium sp. Ji49W TaxID=3413040 RepID=UPI003BF38AA1